MTKEEFIGRAGAIGIAMFTLGGMGTVFTAALSEREWPSKVFAAIMVIGATCVVIGFATMIWK